MSTQPIQNSSQLEAKIADLNGLIGHKDARITMLLKAIDQKNQMLDDLNRDIDILKRAVDEKWEDLKDLSAQLSKAHARNVLLQERVDEAEDIEANQSGRLKTASFSFIMAVDKAAGKTLALDGKYSNHLGYLAAARNVVADLVGIKKVEIE